MATTQVCVLAVVGTLASALVSCRHSDSVADQCRSRYPNPTAAQLASDTLSIPPSRSLPFYRPADSLPRIYNGDSTIGWFRNLFYAHFDAFPGGKEAVHGFVLRFQAQIIGIADTSGWYAVRVPDPGPDAATFRILSNCIGATYGVYVHPAYARGPSLLGDSTTHVPPN